ncbi:MAG: helix-turn-helix transcriptional regulator [Hadesarchaea archaeon]|nr:helix-turn-helix transcriptional regulator [Hadesarchaea archaeon]
MTERKILPLTLIHANGGEPVEGRTRLQKMIFLIQKQVEESAPLEEEYNYFPYDYGPFSKDLYDDIDELVEEGLVKENLKTEEEDKKKYYYELTSKGREILEEELKTKELKELKKKIEEIKSEYNEMNLPDLLEKIYSKYPEHAEKSVL